MGGRSVIFRTVVTIEQVFKGLLREQTLDESIREDTRKEPLRGLFSC
jgi:hypothetical protein